MIPQTIGFTAPRFMEVVSSALVSDNLWHYKLRAVTFDTTTGVVSTPVDAFELPRECVWNLAEIGNTSTAAMGITLPLPGTFELQPVPDGRLVVAWLSMDDSDKWTGFMLWPNQFDGDC